MVGCESCPVWPTCDGSGDSRGPRPYIVEHQTMIVLGYMVVACVLVQCRESLSDYIQSIVNGCVTWNCSNI